MKPAIYKTRQPRQNGLTILEILVSSALMVIIILGLLLMFNQTQRAFKSSLRQVDVLEGGRAIMDMVVRDLEQLSSPPGYSNMLTFYAERTDNFELRSDGEVFDNNKLTTVLVTTPESLIWHGIKFWPSNSGNGLATLYRRDSTNDYISLIDSRSYNNRDDYFQDDRTNQWYRVAQGIVHFHVRPLDTNGLAYNWNSDNTISFTNDLPQFLEVELGIVEPEVLEQVKGMPPAASAQFLEKQVGKIHIFRQQIPIRTATR